MNELGARLRQAREAQGISLQQAATETRILQQSLVALEESAFERLPSDVVIRGFIRNYAQYLGLPDDELIEMYRRGRGATGRVRIVPATTSPGLRSFVLPNFLGVFFVTLILIGLAYIGLSATGRIGLRAVGPGFSFGSSVAPTDPVQPTLASGATGAAATATQRATEARPTATVPAVAGGTVVAMTTATVPAAASVTILPPTAGMTATATVGRTAPALRTTTAVGTATTRTTTAVGTATTRTPTAPIVLVVEVPRAPGNQTSWVRVTIDGLVVYEGSMASGDTMQFEAQRRVLIRAGKPAFVFVTVNGLRQGPLGTTNSQLVNWSWPPQ